MSSRRYVSVPVTTLWASQMSPRDVDASAVSPRPDVVMCDWALDCPGLVHVGIVTGPGRMLHAPQTGSLIVEEALTPARQNSLIGAGRVTALEPDAGLTE